MRGKGAEARSYPVHVLGVDEIRRAEAAEPREEIAQADSGADRPRPEAGADHLRRGGGTRVADEGVVGAGVEGAEGDDAVPSGHGTGGDGRGDGEGEHHDALDRGARHQDGAAAHHVPHQVDARVHADEGDARVHDGELERVVYRHAGYRHEVRRVADDEPDPGPRLRRDDSTTQQCAPQLGS